MPAFILLPNPLMSPVDRVSVPIIRAVLRRIVKSTSVIHTRLSPCRKVTGLSSHDWKFPLGPNTVSERDLLCFVSSNDSGPVVVARVKGLHTIEKIGVAIAVMKRDGIISEFYAGCEVAFDVGFDVVVGITGSERRQKRGMLAEA
jgi:hypothetical protein